MSPPSVGTGRVGQASDAIANGTTQGTDGSQFGFMGRLSTRTLVGCFGHLQRISDLGMLRCAGADGGPVVSGS